MDRRLLLHELLRATLGSDAVYFQPPNNLQMAYPCVVYSRDDSVNTYADNRLYRHHKTYTVTIIDRDPDSDLPDKLEQFQYCSFDRRFAADDLNHFVFTLSF